MGALLDAVQAVLPGIRDDLAALVAIPSISALEQHRADVERCAAAVAELLRAAGCPDVQIVRAARTDGTGLGKPAVIGRYSAPDGAPTVCLYAHHDVQPAGDLALWSSDPWTITERNGRAYARGVGDDKAGVAVHLAALRAFEGLPPVGVTVFVEGEEEIGSPSLANLLEENHDLLRADVFVIADSGNWDVGAPAFTTTLRGLVDCTVEVRVLDHALHSGSFGGVAPDALTALCRLLATLHDERGNVAIEGLRAGPGPDLDYLLDRLEAETGVLDGVGYLGDGPVVERLWTKPSATVLAIDATRVLDASNTLAPVARAKVSVRIAPDEDPAVAMQALTDHLLRHAPWGAQVLVTDGSQGAGSVIPFQGPVADAARAAFTEAWGTEPVLIGQGGSIPMVADFQRAFPEATVLVTAVCDPDSRAHGIDESLDLADFATACLAETLFLDRLRRGDA